MTATLHVTRSVVQEAEDAVAAQRALEAVDRDFGTIDAVWLRFVELGAKHGYRSVACRFFVSELAKHAVDRNYAP